jgi:hypothetical protein
VLSKLAHDAREQARRGRSPGAATPNDHHIDAQRLAGELELRETLVPSPRKHVLQQHDDHGMPRGVDSDALARPLPR